MGRFRNISLPHRTPTAAGNTLLSFLTVTGPQAKLAVPAVLAVCKGSVAARRSWTSATCFARQHLPQSRPLGRTLFNASGPDQARCSVRRQDAQAGAAAGAAQEAHPTAQRRQQAAADLLAIMSGEHLSDPQWVSDCLYVLRERCIGAGGLSVVWPVERWP